MKKIVSIAEHKAKIKPAPTVEEAVESAYQRFFTPELLSLEEPEGLASGKTNSKGGFVPDGEDEIDDLDINDDKR